MVGFIGGLQRRVGKGKQHAAQKNADCPLHGKVPDAPHTQRGSSRPGAEQRAPGGGQQRRDAPGVQLIQNAPEIAQHHAQRRADKQHKSPPGGGVPFGG